MNSTLGERLRKARKNARLSQGALGKIAKMDQSSISDIETGGTEDPSAKALILMATALRVRPQWLLFGLGDPMDSMALAEDEQATVEKYRRLSSMERLVVHKLLDSPEQLAQVSGTLLPRKKTEKQYAG